MFLFDVRAVRGRRGDGLRAGGGCHIRTFRESLQPSADAPQFGLLHEEEQNQNDDERGETDQGKPLNAYSAFQPVVRPEQLGAVRDGDGRRGVVDVLFFAQGSIEFHFELFQRGAY